MLRRYKCIKSFLIDLYDENGFYDNKADFVKVGTIWERNEFTNILGGDIHLILTDGENKMNWLEISEKTLNEYFKIIEE